jgi:hypothetical protein
VSGRGQQRQVELAVVSDHSDRWDALLPLKIGRLQLNERDTWTATRHRTLAGCVRSSRKLPSEGATALFDLGAKIEVVLGLGCSSALSRLSVHAWGVLGESLTHLSLQECESIASEVILVRLHCEVASSDTR